MIIINNKEIRNTVEQVHKNKDDIENLQENIETDVYTKEEANAKFQDKLTTSDTISIYANNEISVDPDFVVTKNSNGNVNGTLQVAHLQSENWDEDDDCKADVTLGSSARASSINLETSGEESGSRLFLRGSTAVDSEGYIDLYGETRINTKNRIKVYNNDVTPATEETVAYLSDITAPTNMVTTNTDQTITGVKTFGPGQTVFLTGSSTGPGEYPGHEVWVKKFTNNQEMRIAGDRILAYNPNASGYNGDSFTAYFSGNYIATLSSNSRTSTKKSQNANLQPGVVSLTNWQYNSDSTKAVHTVNLESAYYEGVGSQELEPAQLKYTVTNYDSEGHITGNTTYSYLLSGNDRIAKLSDIVIPSAPTTDGTYTLKVTVSNGAPTYSWVLDN